MTRMRCSGLALSFALALCVAASPAAAQAQDVPQWSVREITLTASGTYTNPYTQTGVTATFSGPGGVSKTVRGFWDGGSTFRIRFTPTRVGSWTYTTSSADAGLNARSGTINCTPPLSGNRGFVRRDPAYPYSFAWDDGTRYFMWGTTYYELIRNARAGDAWKMSIDNCRDYGINKVRILTCPWGVAAPANPYPNTYPYAGTPPNLNRDQLNLPHWQKFDEVVQYLGSRRMVADIIIFNENNLLFGTQTQDQRFLRYVLARYAAYPNVIWDIINEWEDTGKPKSYFNAIGTIIRGEDPWMAEGSNLRPLSIHQQSLWEFEYFGTGWPVHAILQAHPEDRAGNGDVAGNDSITYNLGRGMPVVNDEYGYFGDFSRSQLRQAMWGIATAGGYGCAGDSRVVSDGSKPFFSANWADAPEYGDIRRLVDFFTTRGIEYWKMSSQNALRTSGTRVYVLAETGRQYVVYAAVGGSFSVNLAAGTYAARRFNPRTGEDIALPDVAGGGSRSFTMPDSNDWVVSLASPSGLTITGTTPSAYVWGTLAAGALQYIDRSYTFSSVPASFAGLRYLRTANNDKNSTGSSFITFSVNQSVTVYVAHDDRFATKPAWMATFSDTGANLVSGGGTFSLFAKSFSAGTVTLDGNTSNGASVNSMYSVVVRPFVSIDSVSTGRPYALGTAQAGALLYIDRSYTIGSLSSALAGGVLVRTANDDKYVTTASHLTLTLSAPATVYVCYDERATALPAWLTNGGWTLTMQTFANAAAVTRVYAKSVPAGTITLGGNSQPPAAFPAGRSNYVVIVKP